jgi:hypothetical protein
MTTKIEFTFLSLSHSSDVMFESTNSLEDLANDFLMLFTKESDIDYENHKINIQSLQQNTPEFRLKVDKFIESYKHLTIKVFQLKSYFQKLKEGEYFLILPGVSIPFEKCLPFYNYLTSLQDGVDYETITGQLDTLFDELRKTYTIQAVDGSTKKPIGEQDKSKRICRFCNNQREKVSFKNVAHAISESLGNKKIILNEECDECNSEFGSASGIEGSLITYLKFYGLFFGVKGKNGIPKLKGKNFEISNDGHIELKHYADSDEEISKDDALSEAKFHLETFDNIVMQDIYRTLCKYALSILDSSVLPQFQDTINWINGKTALTKLPKVAILASYDFFRIHPSLIVYVRKDDNTNLPYAVGEFHYTFLTFVFIIPLTKSDNKDFTDNNDYEHFWNFFKHYSSREDWKYRDFSKSIRHKFTINLSFKPKDEKGTNP